MTAAGPACAAAKSGAVRRVLGLLLVALLGVGVIPDASAAAPPALVLRGSRSASADLTLSASTTLEVGGFDRSHAMRASMRGSYAGFVVQRTDGSVVVGGVVVRGFELSGTPVPLVFGGGNESVRIPRGRYRVTLLTDGAAQITIPAPGLRRSTVLSPTRAASSSGTVLTSPFPPLVPASDMRRPVVVGAGSTTVLASMQRYAVSVADRFDICLATRGTTCATGSAGGGSGVEVTGGVGSTTSITGLYFYPGDIPPGAYDAVFSTVGAGVAEQLTAFVLRIG